MTEIFYPNINNFLAKINIKVLKFNPQNIILNLADGEEIERVERDFFSVVKNTNSTDEDYTRVWELRHSYEKKYFPVLIPLIEKLDSFYENRNTEYPYQIFLDCKYLASLEITCNREIMKTIKNKSEFINKVTQEFKDFDEFLNID